MRTVEESVAWLRHCIANGKIEIALIQVPELEAILDRCEFNLNAKGVAEARDSALKTCAEWDKEYAHLCKLVERYLVETDYKPGRKPDSLGDSIWNTISNAGI